MRITLLTLAVACSRASSQHRRLFYPESRGRRVTDVDDAEFIERLAAHDVGVVLMIRPAAVGEGSTL